MLPQNCRKRETVILCCAKEKYLSDISLDMYKHIGIYGYRKDFLEKFVTLPQGCLERAESLEQLRALENGYKIRVNSTNYQTVGVDQPDDIARVVEQMKEEGIL